MVTTKCSVIFYSFITAGIVCDTSLDYGKGVANSSNEYCQMLVVQSKIQSHNNTGSCIYYVNGHAEICRIERRLFISESKI